MDLRQMRFSTPSTLTNMRGRMWASDVTQNLIRRVGGMSLGFVANVVTIRILTSNYEPQNYVLFALITSVLLAVPFADLGTGANVVNMTADYASGLVSRSQYFISIKRILWLDIALGALGVAGAFVVLTLGSWSPVLGPFADSGSARLSLTLVVAGMGVMIPIGLGARVLQGLGKAEIGATWGFLAGPVQLICVGVLAGLGISAAFYPLAILLATLATNIGMVWSACKLLGDMRPSEQSKASEARRDRLIATSAPYLIILVSSAAAFQLDRVILIHVSTGAAVASYSIIAMFVVPALALLVATSQNLWPVFRQKIVIGTMSVSWFRGQVLLYLALSMALAGLTMFAVLVLGGTISSGQVDVGIPTLLAASAYLVFAGAMRPVTMLLSTPEGLWAQAGCGLLSALVSVALTVLLGRSFGASGAFLASGIATIGLQLVPLFVYAERMIRSLERDQQNVQPARSHDRGGVR